MSTLRERHGLVKRLGAGSIFAKALETDSTTRESWTRTQARLKAFEKAAGKRKRRQNPLAKWRARFDAATAAVAAAMVGPPRFSVDAITRGSPIATAPCDAPDERGYVATPVDPAAYVSASDILTKYTPPDLPISMDRFVSIIEDYGENRVRWTRPLGKNGRPMRNRRSVHLGDWTAYVKRRLPADEDGFPRLSAAEIEDIERRKAVIRKLKAAEK